MRNTLRMTYFLPGQSQLFSPPNVFETDDGKEWERAVNIAHEKGYKIVKVERVPAPQKSPRSLDSPRRPRYNNGGWNKS